MCIPYILQLCISGWWRDECSLSVAVCYLKEALKMSSTVEDFEIYYVKLMYQVLMVLFVGMQCITLIYHYYIHIYS